MRLYRVRKEMIVMLEVTLAAPDADTAYDQACRVVPDDVWEIAADQPHIESKPYDVQDVTPWGPETLPL